MLLLVISFSPHFLAHHFTVLYLRTYRPCLSAVRSHVMLTSNLLLELTCYLGCKPIRQPAELAPLSGISQSSGMLGKDVPEATALLPYTTAGVEECMAQSGLTRSTIWVVLGQHIGGT
mmetsp:Transcript_7092/g.21836  ORF Transcript_7092/g.21836 Transcript_7092/m.21836 type:complete len:118 (+) Transcript_7092:24-377(+)